MKSAIVLLSFAAVFVSVLAEEPPTCPSEDPSTPVYFPSEDCHKFYECTNGIARLFTCSGDLEFNPVTYVCEDGKTAGCKNHVDPTTTEEPITDGPTKTTTQEPVTGTIEPTDITTEGPVTVTIEPTEYTTKEPSTIELTETTTQEPSTIIN